MSDFTIPNAQKQIRQVNRGDSFGELWATFNIDLSTTPGKVRVGKRLKKILDDADLENGWVQAITLFDSRILVTTTETVFECSADEDPTDAGNWSEEGDFASAELSLGFESDATVFGGGVIVSQETDIAKLVPNVTLIPDWWTGTVAGPALTADYAHTLHVHRTGADTLFVSDKNLVRYYNPAAGHSVITFDETLVAHCFASAAKAVWAGTYTETGNTAFVYEIYVGEQLDGSPVARNAYPVDGRAVLAIGVVGNTPYVITDKGVIQAFNGVGFVTVAHFPFAYSGASLDGVRPGIVQDVPISRPIHPKGVQTRGENLLIFLNSDTETGVPVDERTPSGLWEFDTVAGTLTHRQSVGNAGEVGQQRLERSGPLLVLDNRYTLALVGAEINEGSMSGIGLFGDDQVAAPYGYIITPEIESEVDKDNYEKVTLKARTMGGDESAVLKWRTSKKAAYPQYNDIVWLNATQFTATDISFASAAVGDEVEIVNGYKAGYLAHITAIDGTTTFTATIDENLGTLNELSRIRLQNWERAKTEADYDQAKGEMHSVGIGKTNPWSQLKLLLKGDIELRQLRSKGNAQQ